MLIDELDRADEPFEAFLLEVLADFQVSIPELGVVKAERPPIVIITSNRTREIHDAIKRRCLYHWVDFPDAARELEILHRKVPGASERLSREVVAFVQSLRKADLFKLPGVAETLDWAQALTALDTISLSPDTVQFDVGRPAQVPGRLWQKSADPKSTAWSPKRAAPPNKMSVLAENIIHFARTLRRAGFPSVRAKSPKPFAPSKPSASPAATTFAPRCSQPSSLTPASAPSSIKRSKRSGAIRRCSRRRSHCCCRKL